MSTNTEPQWYQDLMAKDIQMHGRALRPHSGVHVSDMVQNNIVLTAGSDEMIKLTEDGFYVRGQLVPQDEKEAEEVYAAFKEWLTWATLNR